MKTARQVVKILKNEGFKVIGQTSSHIKLAHADGRRTVVADHPGDIPYKTLKDIEKQTKVRLT